MATKVLFLALSVLSLGAGCTTTAALHDAVRFGDQDAAYSLAEGYSESWRPQLTEFLGDSTLSAAGGARLACALANDGAGYYSLVLRDSTWVCLAWAFAAEGAWGGFTVYAFEPNQEPVALAAYEGGVLVLARTDGSFAAIDHLQWDGEAFSRSPLDTD